MRRDTGKSAEKGVSRMRFDRRRSSAAAIQGISGKRVCREWNSMGMRGNEAATHGNRRKRVCRGRDEIFYKNETNF